MQKTLYRKHRPETFDAVLGQDHIVSVLTNEAKNGKIAHAYLFSGTRGTGKTTTARIFARSIGTEPHDVYEIDAASNRGIDDIREIREAVNTLPYSSKYKVYIIDEVHMLTREAWNAFLKTLEEPPAHCIFIMATTEAHKLPDTVVSRCEQFNFKKPSHSLLTKAISDTAKKEGYQIEKNSSALIATLAEGSFRDALSILQKIINSSEDKKISHQEVERVLGAPSPAIVIKLIESIAKQEIKEGIGAIKEAVDSNTDMNIFLKMILQNLRFVLLLRFSKEMIDFVKNETGEEEFEKLAEFAKTAKNINSKTLLKFLEAVSLQKVSEIPELPIEIALMESCEKNDQS